MARRKPPVTANAGAMRAVLDAHKYETRLLGRIQEHMLSRPEDERDQKHLHPSEIAKSDWCPRQSYYRIAGYPQRKGRDKSYVLENIFDEGHEVHAKWQQRINAMGMLRGRWLCLTCGHGWDATSPSSCVECGAETLQYREVALYNEQHMIMGHADGDVDEGHDNIADDPLIEIKTIGIGTLRFENPSLLMKHSHKVPVILGETFEDPWWESSDPGDWSRVEAKTLVDLDGLWRDIKRPFPSHLRQGMIYCYVTGRTAIIFIYECKWNQQTKEFVVRYKPEHVEDILDQCLDVKYALKTAEPPSRPGWADLECKACTACVFAETCYDTPSGESPHDEEPVGRAGRRRRPSEGRAAEEAAGAPAQASLRATEAAALAGRDHGRRADEAVRGADEVDRLPGGGAGGSRGRRKVRRVRPAAS